MLFLSACGGGNGSPGPGGGQPTLAVVNARVWTGTTAQPWAEALAVAARRIALVGSDERRAQARAARDVDRCRRAARSCRASSTAHVHFLDGGFRLASVQLRDAKTRDEFVARIKAFAATVPAGTWITGGDWDHTPVGRRAADAASGSTR